MSKRISITEKLFIYYLGLCLGTIVLVSTFSYYSARKALLTRTFDQLISVRASKAKDIERFFRDRDRDLQLLSNSKTVSDFFSHPENKRINDASRGSEEYLRYLYLYLMSNGYYKNIIFISNNDQQWVAPLDGPKKQKIQLYENDSLPVPVPLTNIIDRIKQSGHTIIQDYTRDKEGNPRLMLGTLIRDPATLSVTGIIVLEVSIDIINSIMYENSPHNGLGKTGESYLVGDDYLMRTTSRFQKNSLFRTEVRTRATSLSLSGITGTELINDYRNIPVLSSFGKINIPGLNWVILAEIDTAEAMVPVYTLRNSILVLSILISILIFFLVYLISRRMTSPIIRLKQAVKRIAEGSYNTRVATTSGDEIGSLTDAFNQMAEQLEVQSKLIQEERIRTFTSMIDGQEMERQRLSRDLHDGLGQSLLAVRLKLDQAKSADPEKSKKYIEETTALIRETIKEIRSMSANLMPPVLQEFGIEQGLRKLCHDTTGYTGITINFSCDIHDAIRDQRTGIYLYRIGQEAINNIVKHSSATEAEVFLKSADKQITLVVADNGKGFNTRINHGGNGINNLIERTELLKGECKIVSGIGKGTRITVKIPFNHE